MIRFEPTSRMADITVPDGVEMHWISAEQSNSSVIVGDVAIIKMFRRVTDGPHPEAEMGRYLTENGFANTPALLGEVVRVDPDGTRHALAIAQAFVRNQGDAWTWTLDLLLRGLSDITGGDERRGGRCRQPRRLRAVRRLARPARWARCTSCWPGRPSDPAFAPATGTRRDARRPSPNGCTAQLDSGLSRDRCGRWDAGDQDRPRWIAAREALFARLPALADAGRGRDADPHPRRPASGSGAGVQRRRRDHRFRRRAGQAGRDPPRQGPSAARRRRHDPIVRLCRGGGASGAARPATPIWRTSRSTLSWIVSSSAQPKPSWPVTGRRLRPPERSRRRCDTELLDLFLIEKAAYEVVYEAANRPTWIDVPLHGLAVRTRHLLGDRGRCMNDAVVIPSISPEQAWQLATGCLRDPFSRPGAVRNRDRPLSSAPILPGATRRRGRRPCRRPASGHAVADPAGWVVHGPGRRPRTLPVAHPMARRGAGNRGPLQLRPAAERNRPASVQRRPAVRDRLHPGRQPDRRSTACAAPASPSGRRMPARCR